MSLPRRLRMSIALLPAKGHMAETSYVLWLPVALNDGANLNSKQDAEFQIAFCPLCCIRCEAYSAFSHFLDSGSVLDTSLRVACSN